MQELIPLLSQYGDFIVLFMIFASVMFLTFALMKMTTSWFAVRRRATTGGFAQFDTVDGALDLTGETDRSGVLDYVLPKNEKDKSALRQFLNLAGFHSYGATVVFQISRLACAVGIGLATPFAYSALYPKHPFYLIALVSVAMTYCGYMLPRTIVSLRRDKLIEQHRIGFPDFLDLLVICVEAGIGMDAAIERVGTELARAYPSLSWNLKFMSMEMRAGRATRDALENLGARLGIDEAKSFATLIMQSEELGSSLVQALRVYSDEMRQKRMARAEEKAHSLPVKLVLPLGLFIFPVILGVTMFPIALKIYQMIGS